MSLNKNMSMDAEKCRSCSHMATVTISPTLLTDREVKYNIQGHDITNMYGNVDYTDLYAKIEDAINESKAYTDKRVNNIDAHTCERVKYEVVYKPVGTLVDYREQEVRIMCPSNTNWVRQSVGANGDASKYYIGFRTYAPDDAVSFKESIDKTITDDTMYYFEYNEFAGIDENGRKYSIIWLPVAAYDESTNTWTYYGVNSSADKYIGWYYSVEWYNSDGVIIESDCVRISLSNETCYTSVEPSYLTDMVEDVVEVSREYTDEQIQKIMESVDDATDEDIENLFN